jgi:hypothetical protein
MSIDRFTTFYFDSKNQPTPEELLEIFKSSKKNFLRALQLIYEYSDKYAEMSSRFSNLYFMHKIEGTLIDSSFYTCEPNYQEIYTITIDSKIVANVSLRYETSSYGEDRLYSLTYVESVIPTTPVWVDVIL